MPPRKRAEPGKRAASETSPREGQFIQPVRPSTAAGSPLRRDSRPRHAAPDDTDPAPKTPRKRAAKAAPKSAPPAAAPKSAPPASGKSKRSAIHATVIEREGRAYADRQAYRATHGKPSVVGRGVAGGAAGAASGAALGTIVPGVGNAVGAGAGAVLGAAGGAVGGARAKREYKRATRTGGTAKRIIIAEFAVCIVIAALSPMTDEKRNEAPGAWMKRMSAIMGLFFVLGLLSAAGAGTAKAAAGFGGVVTVALMVSDRNLFVKLAGVFKSTANAPAAGTGGGGAEADFGVAPQPPQRYLPR